MPTVRRSTNGLFIAACHIQNSLFLNASHCLLCITTHGWYKPPPNSWLDTKRKRYIFVVAFIDVVSISFSISAHWSNMDYDYFVFGFVYLGVCFFFCLLRVSHGIHNSVLFTDWPNILWRESCHKESKKKKKDVYSPNRRVMTWGHSDESPSKWLLAIEIDETIAPSRNSKLPPKRWIHWTNLTPSPKNFIRRSSSQRLANDVLTDPNSCIMYILCIL